MSSRPITSRLVTHSGEMVRHKRHKRHKSPWVAICACRNVRRKRSKRTKSRWGRHFPKTGTIFLASSYVLANVPSVIPTRHRHPYHLGWDGLRVSGGAAFPNCQKCSFKSAH
jgi:hypothetical protein